MRCDTSYIPLWPIFYRKEGSSKTRVHFLWPLITYLSTSTNTTFAILYIFFRWTYKGSKVFFDILWPIIHFEYDDDTGGFHFGIRPLFWLIVTPNKTQVALLGIIHYRYKDSDDIWFVIAPFVWYRCKNGKAIFTIPPIFWMFGNDTKDTLSIYFIPFGALKLEGSKGWSFNLLLIFNIKARSDCTTVFLLPFFFIRVADDFFAVNIMVILHFFVERSGSRFYWFLLPFIYHFKGPSHHKFMLVPLFFYLKSGSNLTVNAMLLYYYKKSVYSKIHLIALLYVVYSDAANTYVNVLLLFNYLKTMSKKWIILFPMLWIRIKKGENFLFHLWPLFGYKISQKSRGYNIYLLYPAVIYKNKNGGQYTLFNLLFPIIHYYRDIELKARRFCILPLFYYSKMDGVSTGFVTLYYWYTEMDRYKLSTNHTRNQIEISSPNGVEYEMNTLNGDIDPSGANTDIQKPEDRLPNSKYALKIRALLPLIFYAVKGEDKIFTIIPLFFCRWSTVMRDSYFVSLIYYQKLTTHMTKRWLIPIFYQKRHDENLTVLSPIFYRIKRGTSSFTLILPLFVDIVKGESHIMVLLFPMFVHYRKSIFKFTTLFPFYFQTQDASKGEYFVYYFPVFGNSSKGSSSKNYYFLFPLFGYKRRDDENSVVFDVFFPIFHYEKSNTSHSIRFLPIFWKSVNEYHEILLFMPFYWKFITNKDTSPQTNLLVFPFYFKRNSPEYNFRFASPAFLPPYYVHYHREKSQVEQTYLFPFFAHKIKGLDHLRWFLLILYRHTWRDFSENYSLNVLLYFQHNDDNIKTSGIIPLWVQWFNKKTQEYHLRIVLLLALDKKRTELQERTRVAIFWLAWRKLALFVTHSSSKQVNIDSAQRSERYKVYLFPFFHWKSTSDGYWHLSIIWLVKPFIAFFHTTSVAGESYSHMFLVYYRRVNSMSSLLSIIWFFHPVVSMFLRETTIFHTITRIFPLFYYLKPSSSSTSTNEPSVEGNRSVKGKQILSLFYLYPGFGLFSMRKENYSFASYVFLLYNYSKNSDGSCLGIFWFIHPVVSLYYHLKTENAIIVRLFPIFYAISDPGTLWNLSILWIGHPAISIIRYYRSLESHVTSVFPVFWKKYSIKDQVTDISLIYIVRRFGFIGLLYSPDEYRFYIMFLIWVQRFADQFRFSLMFLVVPRIAVFRLSSKDKGTKCFMFLAFYYKSVAAVEEVIFSIMWFIHPKVSFISYYRLREMSRFYILLVLWYSQVEGYVQFGLLWLFPKNYHLGGNQYISSHRTIKIPIGLFLYLNDGEMQVTHLMPLFRYSNNVRSEKERFWTLFGAIYFASNQGHPDFRFFYRLIRVKSAKSYFLLEVNPFFSYKNKNSQSQVLLLGGCCGCYRRSNSNLDTRVLCIEC
ncbi:hypothetical protein DLAC_11106 [Tieghemostelium lacteum]|uniref:Uncharacterized protein n=1 Tax=Tieghemostelium lacteum TaxID=361077 RepID=A0A151Z384_TIELA|nr:hypothetical protein DLAC_11106 [Tieghemostelium lacteum]|eukprot:KYQ88405.1 hypothetical protein DLAC_11106 [Tieghemostelium lacteum]